MHRSRLALTLLESRLTPAGGFDPSFNGGVPMEFDVGPGADRFFAVAVDPAGRILAAGESGGDMLIARLTPNGQLDATFGGNGVVRLDVAGWRDEARGVAVAADGTVLVGGRAGTDAGDRFALVRLDPAGRPLSATLTGFGRTGTADGLARGMAVSPRTGDVYVVGTSGSQFAVARYSAGGDLLGHTRVAAGVTSTGWAAAVAPDGRLFVAGGVGGGDDPAVARLNADLSDPVARVVPMPGPAGTAKAVAVSPDGRRVYLAGEADPTGTGADFAVLALDPDLGEVARTYLAFGPAGDADRGRGIAVDPQGRVVVAGRAVNAGGSSAAVARLLPDTLALDPTVGGERFDFGRYDRALAVALDPQGRAVLAGNAGVRAAVARVRLDSAIRSGPQVLPGRPLTGLAVGGAAGGLVEVGGGRVTPVPGHPGGVRVAAADLTGDGVADLVAAPGPGGGPRVTVSDGATGAELGWVMAFESAFTGGLFVATADLTGDGKAEVVVTPDRGGGPVVAVFDGAGLVAGRGPAAQLARFFGIEDGNFRGGARAALGDVNADGAPDLLVAAGFGGGPRLATFDGRRVLEPVSGAQLPPKLFGDFFVFEQTLRNGVFVAAGDLTDDGAAEVVVGGGPGGGPRVMALDGKALVGGAQIEVANFFAGDASLRGGVRVAVRSAAGGAEVITGSGDGEAARVRIYPAAAARAAGPASQELTPFDGAVLADGVYVG